jgi:hypothetical protein
MPYAPGIQDISGQLIAQGMSQAGAARARAIESLGESITGGIKTYQQNQIITNQALGKFGMGIQQDPEFKAYVQQVISDDPNAPQVPPALKKAFQNAASGKVDIYDAALLGTATDGYQQSKAARAAQQLQLLQGLKMMAEVQALTAKGNQPKYIMSQEELMKQYPQEKFDVSGVANVPGMPGMVDVSGMKISTRAPAAPQAPVSVGAEGGTLVDPKTGELRVIPALARAGQGEMIVGGPAAISQFAGRPTAAPAGIAQFTARPGTMAPPAGLLAGPQPAPEQATPMAPVAPAAPEPALPRVVQLEGSKAKLEMEEKRKREGMALQARNTEINRAVGMIDEAVAKIDAIEKGKPFMARTGQFPKARQMLSDEAMDLAAKIAPITSIITFEKLQDLRSSGTTLGQVAVRELETLAQTGGNLTLEQSTPQLRKQLVDAREDFVNSAKRLKILMADFEAGRTEPSKAYYEAGGNKVSTVKRLNVNRGSQPGTSTLSDAATVNAYEGRIIRQDSTGKRFRVTNGKLIPID